MQLEGIDDGTNEIEIDLERHFKEFGLSAKAYKKIAPDIESGDMNVKILTKCNEEELVRMANDYQLSFLQKKAFIEAIKQLPNAQASNNPSPNYNYKIDKNKPHNDKNNNNNNNSNHNNNNNNIVPVFISPNDQKKFDEINKLNQILQRIKAQNRKIKKDNTSTIKRKIEAMRTCGKLWKDSIDYEIDTSVKQV